MIILFLIHLRQWISILSNLLLISQLVKNQNINRTVILEAVRLLLRILETTAWSLSINIITNRTACMEHTKNTD